MDEHLLHFAQRRKKMRLSGCFCTVTEVVHTDLVSMRIPAAVGLPVAKLDAHLTQSFATSLLLVVGSCVSATLIIIMV